jgi:chromate transporter
MSDTSDQKTTTQSREPAPTFGEAASYWVKLGFTSFGGPAGQIAMMQNECVDRRGWIEQGVFLRGLNFSMLLPGPEAQQLAAYIGWRLHGIPGALFAGTMFILPGALFMIFLAWIAAAYGDQGVVAAVFEGIKPVVVAIVITALYRIGKRALNGLVAAGLAVFAFVALQFLGLPFPLVILIAGVMGMILAKAAPSALSAGADPHAAPAAQNVSKTGGGGSRFAKITAVCAVLLVGPSALTVMIFGTEPFVDVIKLFTTAAFVTFGGAYAVLPFVADAGVNTYGWLTGDQMINGLALAETTPGPLILVTTYVGFFAGWIGNDPVTGIISALLTTYVTFLPSFYLILSGAPYVERVQEIAWARDALTAITAAVVGVILNLAVFLAVAAFMNDAGEVQWISVAAALAAFGLLITDRISVPIMVVLGAMFGLALSFV